MAHTDSLALCEQENTLDIALDTFRSLVSISEVRDTQTPNFKHLSVLLVALVIQSWLKKDMGCFDEQNYVFLMVVFLPP